MRMLLIMGVTLYTSRVVLRVLGVEDFGIYNVVGGVVSIMSFFISSLSNVTQRYMNIGLGKQDLMETGCAFRQSLTLMWLLSVLLLLFGETLGLWFVYNKLVIPPERLGAAVWAAGVRDGRRNQVRNAREYTYGVRKSRAYRG